jgi:hypothetical protein
MLVEVRVYTFLRGSPGPLFAVLQFYADFDGALTA